MRDIWDLYYYHYYFLFVLLLFLFIICFISFIFSVAAILKFFGGHFGFLLVHHILNFQI